MASYLFPYLKILCFWVYEASVKFWSSFNGKKKKGDDFWSIGMATGLYLVHCSRVKRFKKIVHSQYDSFFFLTIGGKLHFISEYPEAGKWFDSKSYSGAGTPQKASHWKVTCFWYSKKRRVCLNTRSKCQYDHRGLPSQNGHVEDDLILIFKNSRINGTHRQRLLVSDLKVILEMIFLGGHGRIAFDMGGSDWEREPRVQCIAGNWFESEPFSM
jgi:hypothetical protein